MLSVITLWRSVTKICLLSLLLMSTFPSNTKKWCQIFLWQNIKLSLNNVFFYSLVTIAALLTKILTSDNFFKVTKFFVTNNYFSCSDGTFTIISICSPWYWYRIKQIQTREKRIRKVTIYMSTKIFTTYNCNNLSF